MLCKLGEGKCEPKQGKDIPGHRERCWGVMGAAWARDAAGAQQPSPVWGENEAQNSLSCSGKRRKEILWQCWSRTARTAGFGRRGTKCLCSWEKSKEFCKCYLSVGTHHFHWVFLRSTTPLAYICIFPHYIFFWGSSCFEIKEFNISITWDMLLRRLSHGQVAWLCHQNGKWVKLTGTSLHKSWISMDFNESRVCGWS